MFIIQATEVDWIPVLGSTWVSSGAWLTNIKLG
jgi:hypothetical protein